MLGVERNLRMAGRHFCMAKRFLNNVCPLLQALDSNHDAHTIVRDICRLLWYAGRKTLCMTLIQAAGRQIQAEGTCFQAAARILCSLIEMLQNRFNTLHNKRQQNFP